MLVLVAVVVVAVVVVGSGDSIDHNRSCNRQPMNSVLRPRRLPTVAHASHAFPHRIFTGRCSEITRVSPIVTDFFQEVGSGTSWRSEMTNASNDDSNRRESTFRLYEVKVESRFSRNGPVNLGRRRVPVN